MTPFGKTSAGATVDAITLSAHGLRATILTYGTILQDVRLDGIDHSLTLGSDRMADYEGVMEFHGAIVGPVANRLRGATVSIDGVQHRLDANMDGGHTLHSGKAGVHSKVWSIDSYSQNTVILSHKLMNGDAGFPANRHITAMFEIIKGPALRLTITTTTDAPSIVNVTNHSYWNLDGTDHMHDHTVRVDAAQYLPSDNQAFPTGEIVDVAKTAFDFRTDSPIIAGQPPLDNTFCVAQTRRALTECLWLQGASGVRMAVATSEAGMHLYDAKSAQRPNGPFFEGIAIEAQAWPDAPNHAGFPSIAITPDAPVVQITEWRFSTP